MRATDEHPNSRWAPQRLLLHHVLSPQLTPLSVIKASENLANSMLQILRAQSLVEALTMGRRS